MNTRKRKAKNKCGPTHHNACACREKAFDEWTSVAWGALVSIAAEEFKNADKEKFWIDVMKKEHRCALTMATDTQIAREALKELRKIGKGMA